MMENYEKLHSLEDNNKRMNLSPIVVFVYNRVEHTKRTIEALAENIYAEDSEVYIFSDAPKTEVDVSKVEKVREYIRTVNKFKSLYIIERSKNLGLAANIIDGVTKIVDQYGKIIVLEDDIVTSKYFIKYMNDALSIYKDKTSVMEISGYSYPIDTKGLSETFFLHFGDCWGWGTWNDRWNLFEKDPNKLIKQFTLRDIYHFNLENSYDFWSQVIGNEKGKLNTWAIFWTATIFQHNGLMLYPRDSLVVNIGFDASGDHKSTSVDYITDYVDTPVTYFPTDIEESLEGRRRLKRFFKKIRPNLMRRILHRVKNFFVS